MAVPLEKLVISVYNEETKREEQFPALHPRWMKHVDFVSYQSPPLDVEDIGSVTEWKERMNFIIDDLHWLLRQPHDKFWCQVIFDKSLHRCLDSYLKLAPRCFDVVYNLPNELQKLEDELNRLVYIVCVRMSTYKESKKHFITPEEFGKILYENYIFDIPRLMDLAVLYGASHGGDRGTKPLLTRMITNIFSQQPNYENDLADAIPTILQIFQNISIKSGVTTNVVGQTPQKLDDVDVTPLVSLDTKQFQDVIFYLSDTLCTLWMFIDIYQPAAKAFRQEDFIIKLASLYENLFPALTGAMKERKWSSASYFQLLCDKVRRSQLYLLKIFRQIIFYNCLHPLLDECSEEEAKTSVESYLHLMSGVLAEKWFLCHLNHLYPFRDDRDLLLQSKYPVDETRLQFIMNAVNEAVATHGQQIRDSQNVERSHSPEGATSDAHGYTRDDYEAADTEELLGACAAAKHYTEAEIQSMISSVQDLLPDLGAGFIELCLEEMDYDTEKVIHALLEDNLPPSLQKYSLDLPRQEKAVSGEEPPTVLSERRNVFDNDKFDVFTRDQVDTSHIHKGKRERNVGGAKAVLDDKSTIAALKPLYDRYGHEDVESIYDKMVNEYEDEYDDTYDSNTIGATDANDVDELTAKRIFSVPRVSASPVKNEVSDSEEEDVDERKRDLFIQDPAKIREAQRQRRMAREAASQKHRGSHRNQGQRKGQDTAQGQGEGGQGEKVHDVKGNPRGKGQTADVLHNRAWKEKHKSTRVHHNRKVLADRKRKF